MKVGHHFGAAVLFLAGSFVPSLTANPVGETVRAGSATFHRAPGALTIRQGSDRAIIDWRSFSIGAGESTRFVQPNALSVALNRVVGGDPSALYGSLRANGQVYLINPNGIVVGPGGVINTRSFLASTHEVSDKSFLSGAGLKFSGDSTAPVQNFGTVEALGGDIFLIARTVENSGTLRAASGTVGLAAGAEVLLQQSGRERISVLAAHGSAPPSAVGVNNLGAVAAATAELKAAGGNIYALAINNGGIVRADSLVHEGGRILLKASGGNIENSGTLSARNAKGGGEIALAGGHNESAPATVISSGVIDARGEASGAKGGTVTLTGDRVGLSANARIDVSGHSGGGTALVGGDYRGSNPDVPNAQAAFVGRGAVISADALSRGHGGKVVVWSDGATRFHGRISARGGPLGGDGGTVETSGKNYLEIIGAVVDAGPVLGRAGTWLLDPNNVTIRDAASAHGAFNAGDDTFTPSADDAVADRNTIQASLNNGTDVTINTGAGGSQAGDITVLDSITKSAGLNSPTLTLNAAGSINIAAPISADAGNLHLSLNAAGGGVSFNAPIRTGLGNLTVTATGPIEDNATLTIGGAAAFKTLNDAGATIVLDDSFSTFGSVAARSRNAADTAAAAGPVVLFADGALNVAALETSEFAFLTANGPIDLGNVTAATMEVIASGPITDRGPLTIANDTTFSASGFDITLDDPLSTFGLLTLNGRNVSIRENAVTDLADSGVTGALTIHNAAGGIFSSGTLMVGGRTTLNTPGHDISLSGVLSRFGTLSLQARNTAITENDATDLGDGNVTGALTIQNTAGGITDSGTITVAGDTTLSTPGRDITLNSPASAYGTLFLTANNATIFENSATDLGGASLAGRLTILNSAGGITDSGSLRVAGDTTLTAVGRDITLDSAGSSFGRLLLRGASVSLREDAPMDLGDSTVTGTLTANNTAGGIVNSGPLVAAGAASFTAPAGQDIRLDHPGNEFGASVSFAGTGGRLRDVSLVNNGATAIGGAALDGTFRVTARGPVTQSGAIVAAALEAKTLNDGGAAITLAHAGNEVASVDLRARNSGDTANADGSLAYRDATGFDIVAAQTASTVTLTSGDAVTQLGGAGIAGSTLTVKTRKDGGAAITLNSALNDVASVNLQSRDAADTHTAAGRIAFRSAGGFDVQSVWTTGDADLTSVGSITEGLTGGPGTIQANRLTASTGGDLLLGRDTPAPGPLAGDAQNKINTLGNVTHGGRFYLADSEGGLIIDGTVSGAGPTVIRTAGDLRLSLGTKIIATAAAATVELSAENSGNIRNDSGAGAIQAGRRWIVFSTDPAASDFGGERSDWQANGRTFLSARPFPEDDGGNGFVFATSPEPRVTPTAPNELPKVVQYDLALRLGEPPQLKAEGVAETRGESSAISTSSFDVWRLEAQEREQRKKRKGRAQNAPKNRVTECGLRFDVAGY